MIGGVSRWRGRMYVSEDADILQTVTREQIPECKLKLSDNRTILTYYPTPA